MADTDKAAEQVQTNGVENGLDDEDRSKLRPADIDADVKEMERRKRVEMIMSSKLFREELERIIELQMKEGSGPAGLLQQISDMMGIQSGKLHTTHLFRGPNCVTPINDIRGVESMGYEKGEKNLRCKLASVFRLMDLYGWSQGINNQVTARLNQDEEHFLVNPHGMLFNEITASSLVKVDMQGNIVEPGTTNFTVHTLGFLVHSSIHASRPDVNCVIHIKTPSVLAVSSLKCGLLPLCQEAVVIGEVSQHPFLTGIFEPEEREKIIRNLGPSNKVLLLHNHGAICCGATVEEAFFNVYNTVLACETQIKLMPIGVENLVYVGDETKKQVYDSAHKNPDGSVSTEKKGKQYRVGELEFEALIRMLDNAGFRTGYIYRHPLVKGELPKPKNDVEVPPAVSSLGYLIEQEELYKQGNWKKYVDGRNRLDRTKWLNSPNVYQKVEILETGTSDPKKITKWVDQNSEEWVAESSPTHSSTPVKIESALQFVPKGTNPKEFKKLQQQIKENRRADKITSGPQSHILEGVSWEEAKKLQDANITQTGDQVILVGAASKGIIQRNYQHNALVYKTPYATNPFDSMSDKEIEDYKQLVERKRRGDTDYEESQSESEAMSSSRQDHLRQRKSPLLSPHSATSETEEESRDEPRVLRIETKTAPRPIQAEVVLSDAESDTTDAKIERSHSARYPKAEKPESVNLMNSFRKSWSLKREKDKSKDPCYPDGYDSRHVSHASFRPRKSERNQMEAVQFCVARIKQLTYKPVIVDLTARALRPMLKSASEPCNLDRVPSDEDDYDDRGLPFGPVRTVSKRSAAFSSCQNIASDLQRRLNIRKRLIYSAKMKFLGLNGGGGGGGEGAAATDDVAVAGGVTAETTSTSPMCALISEIRETINEIVSPERVKRPDPSVADYLNTLRWIERPKFVPRPRDQTPGPGVASPSGSPSKQSPRLSLYGVGTASESDAAESLSDFRRDFRAIGGSGQETDEGDVGNKTAETVRCDCVVPETERKAPANDEDREAKENIVRAILMGILDVVGASDDEGTYTVTDDSLMPTYSFMETTETDWYYNKTIMKLENSQTVVEVKESPVTPEVPILRQTDTGIDTDFTSDKENTGGGGDSGEGRESGSEVRGDDYEAVPQVCDLLNKSSETESSILKSSSGQTSNDVDTSFAFRTDSDRERQERVSSPESGEGGVRGNEGEGKQGRIEGTTTTKLPDIPESPEFTNVDTEDAPVTSSSKDTSPDVAVGPKPEPGYLTGGTTLVERETNFNETCCEGGSEKPDKKRRKRNKKSSTRITVKKEVKDVDAVNPIVSEIKLTIKSGKPCQSERYEVKIQDVTNTSEELSSSVGDQTESFDLSNRPGGTAGAEDVSCTCPAQQDLEELQGEVSSTIEKLQTIEDYFESEIKKHSQDDRDERTIEYNYGEVEDMLNECRGAGAGETTVTAGGEPGEVNLAESGTTDASSGYLTSSVLNVVQDEAEDDESRARGFAWPDLSLSGILPTVEMRSVPDGADECGEVGDRGTTEKEMKTSADVQATTGNADASNDRYDPAEGDAGSPEGNYVRSSEVDPAGEGELTKDDNRTGQDKDTEEESGRTIEAVDCQCIAEAGSDDRVPEIVETDDQQPEIICAELEATDEGVVEVHTEPAVDGESHEDSNIINVTSVSLVEEVFTEPEPEQIGDSDQGFATDSGSGQVCESQAEEVVSETRDDNPEQTPAPVEDSFQVLNEVRESSECAPLPLSQESDDALSENAETYTVSEPLTSEPSLSLPVEPDGEPDPIDPGLRIEVTDAKPDSTTDQKGNEFQEYLNAVLDRLSAPAKALCWTGDWNAAPVSASEIVEYILEQVLLTIAVPVSAAGNDDSRSDSLAEFEELENLLSASGSVLTDIIDSIEARACDGGGTDDVVVVPNLKQSSTCGRLSSGRRHSHPQTDGGVFKVTIATPAKKEIFINYSQTSSSTFDLSSDFDFCNSYIKTDDVNEDFDTYSTDPSGCYPPKATSPANLSGTADSFCCTDCEPEPAPKSPRSLSIIQEVDEGESSTSSDVPAISVDK